MSFTFADEQRKPVSKKATTNNPYFEVIKSIAGTERVKSFTLQDHYKVSNAEEVEQALKDARRDLTTAGNNLETPVTVRVRDEVLDDGKSVKVTFWTTKKIAHHKKTPKTETPVTPAKTTAKPAAK